MNWIEEKVADALMLAAPKDYLISKEKLRLMTKSLIKTNGMCPSQLDEKTPKCDRECPCRLFVEEGECRCGLYIKPKENEAEE